MSILYHLLFVTICFANDAWDICRNTSGTMTFNIYGDNVLSFPLNGTNQTAVPFSPGFSCSIALNPAPLTILDVHFSGQNFTNNTMVALYENNLTQGITLSGDPKNQQITPSAVPYLIKISPMAGEQSGTFDMDVKGIKVDPSANILNFNSNRTLLVSTNNYTNESVTFAASDGYRITLFINFRGEENDANKIENLLRYNIFFSQNSFLTTSGHIYKLSHGVYPTQQQSVTMYSVYTTDNDADIVAFTYKANSDIYWDRYNCSSWQDKTFSLLNVLMANGFSALTLIKKSGRNGILNDITWTPNISSFLDVYEGIPELSNTATNGSLIQRFYSNSSSEKISPLQLPRQIYTFVAQGGKVDISVSEGNRPSSYRTIALSITLFLLFHNIS